MMIASTPPIRTTFEADGDSPAVKEVQDHSPPLSSSNALARFEFETGRGNEGTKVLMVEWKDDEGANEESGNTIIPTTQLADWAVSWEGKTTSIAQKDGADGHLHRLYFLLAPGQTIPPTVKIAQNGGRNNGGKEMVTTPLPAIFPKELMDGTGVGKKGVLHTIWGKSRVRALEREIEVEMRRNGEGVGLDMAVQEKEWIQRTFGIETSPGPSRENIVTTPRSPGGGRLQEKLKGLKLGTSVSELSGSPVMPTIRPLTNPLSPDVGDVAVSSFSAFHGGSTRSQPFNSAASLASFTAARPNQSRTIAQSPPSQFLAQQSDPRRMGSLNTIADAFSSTPISSTSNLANIAYHHDIDNDDDDGLFAVTISPRSPDMTRSPFSFSTRDPVPSV